MILSARDQLTVGGLVDAARAFGINNSLKHQLTWAYAELMERRQPLRAGELKVLNSYGSPDKQVEAACRVLDVKVSCYEWRSTKLFRGDDRRAKRYLFQPCEGLWWALIKPTS